ncbi:MAG: hypothetical protein H0T79_18715, partial [Deltaproteobacteria bacterium]|nr:hypothetical protein [Deltaproteobacteria bacterium]
MVVDLGSFDPAKRVLVIDDNKDLAEALSIGLEKMGYTVRVAFDGLS